VGTPPLLAKWAETAFHVKLNYDATRSVLQDQRPIQGSGAVIADACPAEERTPTAPVLSLRRHSFEAFWARILGEDSSGHGNDLEQFLEWGGVRVPAEKAGRMSREDVEDFLHQSGHP
jgi:hypothetical protein